jgi:hypothetical protein
LDYFDMTGRKNCLANICADITTGAEGSPHPTLIGGRASGGIVRIQRRRGRRLAARLGFELPG